MTLTTWLALLAAITVVSLTPGAGAINTMSNSLGQGWARAGWGVLGQQIAIVTHGIIVAAGVGLLVASSPLLFDVIRYTGAAYLVYLGVRLLIARTDAAEGELELPDIREGAWPMVRRGFWVNLLNPKAIVFLLAFMPQFIRADQPLVPQYAIFLVTCVVVDVIVMWGFFAGVARPFRRLTRTPRGRRALNSVFGMLFVLVAVLLLFVH